MNSFNTNKTHLDKELSSLKADLIEMMFLVQKQLDKSYKALLDFDKELAEEVIFNERRINAAELNIDSNCEDIAALFSPVAIDLRFIFASYKINSNLESIGDGAKRIAKLIGDLKKPYDPQLLLDMEFKKICETIGSMLENNIDAFENDNAGIARKVFSKDQIINDLHKKAIPMIATYIKEHPEEDVLPMLNLTSIIRRLERVGDLCCDVAEEIIFYLEAKVLKHQRKRRENE